jgi:LEA14-like dessication related protein
MKKWYWIGGSLAAVGLGYALYRYVLLQSKLLQKYEYKIIGFKINKLKPTELSFNVKVRFTSKANIDAEIKKIYLDVYFEEKKVGYIIEEKPFIIPAKGSSDIELNYTFNPQYVVGNIIEILLGGAGKKDFNFGLEGYAKVKSGLIGATVPIKYKTTIKEYFGLIK